MFEVLEARNLAPDIRYLRVQAPKIALRREPGQFVIVRATSDGERIPLTIADADPREGWIALICQGIGKTTRQLNTAVEGDHIPDVAGPLGMPSRIEHYGNVVAIGGGVGTAIAYPTAAALKQAGNRVVAIIGGRSREYVILEEEMRAVTDEVFPTTDDGSYGYHGFVTGKLEDLIDWGPPINLVLAIGPIPMMRAVADLTRPHQIETVVSLNPIMVDGTGMCGGCRVEVAGEMKFACVDGPEFDAHLVDFDLLNRRNQAYRGFEQRSLEEWNASHDHAAGVSS
ncbi:MAG: sulfide/dihydroorotate dehydrogenase-like FAD/NAD-binding protein [Acidimicrobiia bacterium]|nr:sulfide/dihydroorotate dehydrogenase-like FAD/NAD-binding protein [Acidimicrobiia bacterium]